MGWWSNTSLSDFLILDMDEQRKSAKPSALLLPDSEPGLKPGPLFSFTELAEYAVMHENVLGNPLVFNGTLS